VKVLQGDEWQRERDLVLKERKVYVLKNGELRAEIIQWQNIEVDKRQQSWLLGIIGGQE